MLIIDSAHNAGFKTFLSLTTSKGLKKEGLFLLSGETLIREFLKRPNLEIRYELVTAKLAPLTKSGAVKIARLAPDLFAKIDALGTHFNILVVQQPEIENLDSEKIDAYEPRGLELVAPIGDPANLGALIRSGEAFGVGRVILTQEAAHPFLPKSVKASAGSVLRMPLERGPALRDFSDSCLALDSQGESIENFRWPQNALLVVGEEGKGLGGATFNRRLSIPTQGVESLNATVAASIALALRQFALRNNQKLGHNGRDDRI